jgi:hypothetical protein
VLAHLDRQLVREVGVGAQAATDGNSATAARRRPRARAASSCRARRPSARCGSRAPRRSSGR